MTSGEPFCYSWFTAGTVILNDGGWGKLRAAVESLTRMLGRRARSLTARWLSGFCGTGIRVSLRRQD